MFASQWSGDIYVFLGLASPGKWGFGIGSPFPLASHQSRCGRYLFSSRKGKKAIDGMGLSGIGRHTLGETADLRFLTREAMCTAILLYRLASRNQ